MLETPKEILCSEASTDAVVSFLAWRKMLKKPLTDRAAVMIAKSLREITADSGDADRALDLIQEHGWLTIKPDWYWRQERRRPDYTQKQRLSHDTASAPRPSMPDNRADPALDQIARLAGLGAAPRDGGG